MTKKLTKTDKENACARYIAGESSPTIAKTFNVAPQTIRRMLERCKIARRDAHKSHTLKQCDFRFFQNIDSEVKAYWLGFLSADGYIHSPSYAVRLTIASRDKDHLVRFKTSLNSNHTINEYSNTSRNKDGTHTSDGRLKMVRVTVVSKEMTQDLSRWMSSFTKYNRLQIPDLEPKLMPHFIRGYSDGDGGFSFSTKRPTNCNFRISSPVTILKQIQAVLMSACLLRQTSITRDSRQIESAGGLQYGGKNQVTRIYHYLYDDATVWLPRKRDKAANYLNIP